MEEYANRALRDVITTLAACEGFAETLSKTTYRGSKKAKRNIVAMGNQAHKALDIICDGLDKDQIGGDQALCRNALYHAGSEVQPGSGQDPLQHHSR